MGDWFVLYQLSKNVDSFFFRMFINELDKGMRDDASRGSIQIQPPTPSGRSSNRNSYPHSLIPPIHHATRPRRSEVSIEVESASDDSEPKKIDEEPEPEDGTLED